MRPTTKCWRLLCCAIGIALLTTSSTMPAMAQTTAVDRSAAYSQLWYRATIAVAAVVRQLPANSSDLPPADVSRLTNSTDALENAVSALIRSTPPEDGAVLHVMGLPRLIRIVGTLRDALHEAELGNKSNVRARMQVLDFELTALQQAMSRFKVIDQGM